MDGEPVDRRGLLRNMFRQASELVVPAIIPGGPGGAAEKPKRAGLPLQSASLEQLCEAAAELGLGEHSEAVVRLSRRSLRLGVGVGVDGQAGSGTVVFGGPALMSEEIEWPSWKRRPLALLAQVETGEPLGRLLFFYDAVGRPSGCLAAHRGTAAVVRAAGAPLLPREGLSMPLAPVAGAMAAELVLPRVFSDPLTGFELSQPGREAWQALRERLAELQGSELGERRGAGFRAVHRIFGYPDSTDDEMALTCELASRGEDVIQGRARLHRRAEELRGPAARWELLAQLSWDAKLSWPWAAQRIYFWIDRDALGRGELGEVWAIAR